MRFSKFLPKGKLKMRDSLFGYMMILTIVILVVIAFGMIMLGTFAKPSDTISNTLELQMEVFEKEIASHHEELAMRSTSLSSETSRILSYYLRANGLVFEDLGDSPEHIAKIQKILLELLAEEILKTQSHARRNTREQIIQAGYDIEANAQWLQDFYLEQWKEA